MHSIAIGITLYYLSNCGSYLFPIPYYPCGNVFQLFDIRHDPKEHHDLAGKPETADIQTELTRYMMDHMHGCDLNWIQDGKLCGFPAGDFSVSPDYGLFNQRGLHWPTPSGYGNSGKT